MKRPGMMRIWLLALVVAASAVALRNDREITEGQNPTLLQVAAPRWPAPVRSLIGPTLRLGHDFAAALIVMTAGLVLAATRRPFVEPGRRWPGRGRAAIAAAGLGIVYHLLDLALERMMALTSLMPFGPPNPQRLSDLLQACESAPKDAILGAWTLLVVAGRWKSEPSDGLERLGRLLGWGWLSLIAFDLFRSTLW